MFHIVLLEEEKFLGLSLLDGPSPFDKLRANGLPWAQDLLYPSTGSLRPAQGERKSKSLNGSAMRFWVYMLQCADRSYYTGHTDDLERRVAEHQSGIWPGYTSSRRPVTLVYSEEFTTREEALACERRIKGWGRKKKEAMMRGDWAEVARLAKGGGSG